MYVPMFFLRQKFAMTTNRYELQRVNPDGQPRPVLGVADQKRMAFKEEVTFYADDTKTRTVFSFKARAVMDLNAGYDVFDEAHQQIGFFRKDFGPACCARRSTSRVRATPAPGRSAARRRRSCAGSRTSRSCRSTSTTSTPDGQPLLSVERQGSVRDRYTVRVPDPRVDFRVAAAVAVAMDALMGR